jgi:hypothetical protein
VCDEEDAQEIANEIIRACTEPVRGVLSLVDGGETEDASVGKATFQVRVKTKQLHNWGPWNAGAARKGKRRRQGDVNDTAPLPSSACSST